MRKLKQNQGEFARKIIQGKEAYRRGKATRFYISYGISRIMDDMIKRMKCLTALNILSAIPGDFQPGGYIGSSNVPAKLDESESIIPNKVIIFDDNNIQYPENSINAKLRSLRNALNQQP